ncbi:hypothetical protein C2G38_2179431 [Gigaspora rosea]|uniref:Uncharacterized protein n=1 Tax=Gigaspora rosea TaxID=44941 RepID=A0A397VD77_9GLOM|nr:hypothetical protein C2G38_2179431 [Gigaspora rosea]
MKAFQLTVAKRKTQMTVNNSIPEKKIPNLTIPTTQEKPYSNIYNKKKRITRITKLDTTRYKRKISTGWHKLHYKENTILETKRKHQTGQYQQYIN